MGRPVNTAEQYARQLRALLPPGLAWSGDQSSVLFAVMDAAAVELSRIDGRAADLEREWHAPTTFELLADFERVLGLPDDCAPAPESVAQRRDAVVARLIALGGASPEYFIALAASVGYTITITEFRPFRAGRSYAGDALTNDDWPHAWQVNGLTDTIGVFRAGANSAGDRLRWWGNQLLECLLSIYKPAHTILIFAYIQPITGAAGGAILPSYEASGIGSATEGGVGAAAMPTMTATGAGVLPIIGSADGVLPAIEGDGEGAADEAPARLLEDGSARLDEEGDPRLLES